MKPIVKKIADAVRKHRKFLVTSHVRGDGDAIGAQLALGFALRKLGKKVDIVCDRGVMADYRFLPGAEKVGSGPEDLRPPYDAVLVVDAGSWERLERVSAALDRKASTVVNVDHHLSNTRFGDLNWIDARYASSAEMVWEIIRALRVKPDRRIATCIYVGIVTDTGKFSFSNTKPATHRAAAEMLELGVKPQVVNHLLFRQKTPEQMRFLSHVLDRIRVSEDGGVGWVTITRDLIRATGFDPGDTQEYVDAVKSIRGVKVAVLLRELDGKVKMSFRTQEGVDGVRLASKWGGGGHARASGASVDGRLLNDVEREVVAETIAFVRKCGKK
ncbi:MAG: DHH family phosphoesterase [Planctomycetota bacterium]